MILFCFDFWLLVYLLVWRLLVLLFMIGCCLVLVRWFRLLLLY